MFSKVLSLKGNYPIFDLSDTFEVHGIFELSDTIELSNTEATVFQKRHL